MKKISVQNEELLDLLNDWVDWFYEQDDRHEMADKENIESYVGPKEHSISDEYLYEMLQKKFPEHDGYPEAMYGAEMSRFWTDRAYNKKWTEKVNEVLFELNLILTAKRNALCAYYPPGGFIGWHTNWNCAGHNIILSYSKTGEGCFKYYDLEKEEIVTIQDDKGWNCKVGYFGSFKEPGKEFWHCATTDCDRLTFSFVIPDQHMWEMITEEICNPVG